MIRRMLSLGVATSVCLSACGGGGAESAVVDAAATTLPPAADEAAANSAAGPAVDAVSPARRLRRDPRPPRRDGPPPEPLPFRSLDGSGNNLARSAMGAASTPLRRLMPSDYADGRSAMAGSDRPSPRAISQAVFDQSGPEPNPAGLSDVLWQWGQFLDHDIDLTDGMNPPEPALIAIPAGDPWFDPDGSGVQTMRFNRSLYDTANAGAAPRQQMNEITAWIDASNVYGSDAERAEALRTLDGSGQLRTSAGNLLPFNDAGLPNAGGDAPGLFLAGDVRANEQLGLTAMHSLFMREHNRRARALAADHPDWDGERVYQEARARVAALMQIITYEEFLPALLGPDALPPYAGYDPDINAGISNAFSTAAYRLGHSMLSDQILLLDATGQPLPSGPLSLRDAFFAPGRLAELGLEPILRGLAAQRSQRIDHLVVDGVRNFLFGPPGAGGFDLVSLNIQRGRDHGLLGYNASREALGLPAVVDFTQINAAPEVANRLAAVYASPDEIDLWVGGLAEAPVAPGQVGPTFRRILIDQFRRLRDGDRYWWQRTLAPEARQELAGLRLADVIRANTRIDAELADHVFRVPDTNRRN